MSDHSDDQSVIISEELPIVESANQKSMSNRFSKFINRIGQNEWMSEFDLFSIPLKLNFNGSDTYKTQFGGFVYLLVGICCVVVTVFMLYPNGIQVKAPITFYTVTSDAGNTQTVFDYTDSFFTVYLYNPLTKQKVTGGLFNFLVKKFSVWQNVDGVGTQLQVFIDADLGNIYFNSSDTNSGATIYGTSSSPSTAKLHFQMANCGLFDDDPDYGSCIMALFAVAPVMEVTNFIETTGGITQKRDRIVLSIGLDQIINVDRNQYTTNNNFLGYIANILSYELDYYTVSTESYSSFLTHYDTTFQCADFVNICLFAQLQCSGSTNIVTQNYDDITAPILFFMSLSQTLFYIIYILMLKNYANNALKLRIADTLVYITQPNGRHYNFKQGLGVFFGCLIYKHPLIQLIDLILYHFFQTHLKKILPLKVQLTMDMINYGDSCLDQRNFFGEINQIYSQENVQPSKIIVDIETAKEDETDKKSEKEGSNLQEEQQKYFEDDISEEAFARMCEQHQFYSSERKTYLKKILLETDKKYKLVLMTQDIFEKYKKQVAKEKFTKQIDIPITYAFEKNEDLSGHQLKKQQQLFK